MSFFAFGIFGELHLLLFLLNLQKHFKRLLENGINPISYAVNINVAFLLSWFVLASCLFTLSLVDSRQIQIISKKNKIG